ncbi:neuronal acetylcholine receptor subunit alpha-10 isoform X3 [Octopus bimaculoides]|uniref:neuronal acetylcholine receptor subunit alpha-10 isoform X3 n=1 Tax=Octopus bimaculoides TaxID=37653 RepID=UPI0022E8FD01|nr:neuronal acetylcholine receptor subunit alpha-10 isoform X3 [Octopus bimaculoides]
MVRTLIWLPFLLQGALVLSQEKRLIKTLIEQYQTSGKTGRPVNDPNETITVEYGVSLIQILDLDERNQILSINVWITYQWRDIYLKWNPEDYGMIKNVRIPPDAIWMPDIKLYNYADTRLEEKRDALVVLKYNGTVFWMPQAIFKSSCSIDITYFPFDAQTCYLKFGSWTYDGNKLDVKFWQNVQGFELTDYVPSNEWDILDSSAIKHTKYYPCCSEPYPDLTFTLKIKRKVAFYNYILILPCVLLSSLTMVLFWLPPESPAKMQLGMNIFVAFFVLLLLLAESTPPAASAIPLIGAYYCLNMILITLSTFLSVIVVNLYFHGSRSRVPPIVKKVMVDFFGRMLCMQTQLLTKEELLALRCRKRKNSKSSKDRKKMQEIKYDKVGTFEMQTEDNWVRNRNPILASALAPIVNGTTSLAGATAITPASDIEQQCNDGNQGPWQAINTLEGDVKEIRRHLQEMTDKVSEKEAGEIIAREWKHVALVLDRIFFFMYLSCIVASIMVIFPKVAYHL